ncbi:phosphatidylglycerol lysyltransferase domain-containing protein, partial [Streptomyces sp. NPDC056159]|uniref:phosphatidylglycerol lysyltransferase domain-containing protein n=1 Tax=Streptomyces sp. NPDC056159 TaxID=3155537 RepID=UPI0034141327
LDTVTALMLVFLSRWFQIESLYKFNAKFQPRWEPRFVVYRASSDLPRIGFAAMQAEGFVDLALPLPRFLRRRSAAQSPCAHSVAEGDMRAA